MKRFTKLFAMMMVVMMVVGMFTTVSLANNELSTSFIDIKGSNNQGTEGIKGKVEGIGGDVIYIISTVARVVALAMVAVFAVKWMLATPQKKQELKERLIYLAIGVVLLFAGPSLLGIIAEFGKGIQ